MQQRPVDDFSQMAALRMRNICGTYLESAQSVGRTTLPMLELKKMLSSPRAVELGKETAQNLAFLGEGFTGCLYGLRLFAVSENASSMI